VRTITRGEFCRSSNSPKATAPATHHHYESNNVNEVHRVRKTYNVTPPDFHPSY